MRSRKDILNDLITIQGDISALLTELSQYPWDCDKPIVTLTNKDLLVLLTKALLDNAVFDKLEEWADVVEMRDDIEFESDEVHNAITELANPELFNSLSKERLKLHMNNLQLNNMI